MIQPKLRFKREDGTDYPEWEKLTLGERFTFKNGINASREAFRTAGIHCIGVSDVIKCLPILAINVIGTVGISDKEVENNKVDYGDILFQRSSETQQDIGHASVYVDNIPSVYNGFVICGKPDRLFYNPVFLHNALQHSKVRKQTISLGAGAQHYNIGQEGLAQINVNIPHLEEQQKIADFLSTVNEVIAQSEAEVRNLEQQKKAAMQKIFSQEVRFRREDETEYPEWEEKKLENIGHFYGGLTGKSKEDFGTGSSRYITYMNVNRNLVIRNDILETVDVSDNEKQNAVEYGDLIFTQSSETVDECGLTSVYLYSDKPYLNSFCMGFRLDNFDVTEPLFTAYLMRSERVRKEIMVNSQGISRINLSGNRILQMSIFVPCLEEQQKIADFLSAYDETISYAKQELDKWRELKKGLLQQMFV